MAGTKYQIEYIAHDLFGSSASASDSQPPFVTDENPAPGQAGVPVVTNIFLKVDDLDAGVDITTVIILIEGVVAYDDSLGGFQPGFTGPAPVPSGLGYNFDINPDVDLAVNAEIDVRVIARDLASNLADVTYSFFTTARLGAQFNLSLRAKERGIDQGIVTQEAVKFS
jgi:hypothetical protein